MILTEHKPFYFFCLFFSIVTTKPSAIDIYFHYSCFFFLFFFFFNFSYCILIFIMYYLTLRGVACTFLKTHTDDQNKHIKCKFHSLNLYTNSKFI